MRFSAGANSATSSQLSRKPTSRMATKRRPLQGSIGVRCGARSARGSPGFDPRGGRALGGAAGRSASAITPIVEGSTRPTPIVGQVRQQLRPLFDQVVIKELDPDRVR